MSGWTQAAILLSSFTLVVAQYVAKLGYQNDDERWLWQVRVTGAGHRWQLLAIAAAAVGLFVNASWVVYIDGAVILAGTANLTRRLILNRQRKHRLTDAAAVAQRRARREEVDRLWRHPQR